MKQLELPKNLAFDASQWPDAKAVAPDLQIFQHTIKSEQFYFAGVSVRRDVEIRVGKFDVKSTFMGQAIFGYAKHLHKGFGIDSGDNYDIIWDMELSNPLSSGCITACAAIFHAHKGRFIIMEGQNDIVLNIRGIIQGVAQRNGVDPSLMMQRYRQVRKCFEQIPTFVPPDNIQTLIGNMKVIAQDEIIKD